MLTRLLIALALLLPAGFAHAASNDCVVTSGTPTLQAGTSAPCYLNQSGEMLTSGSFSGSISGADGAIVDGSNAALKATVLDLTNSNPVTTAIVDSSGNQITSFGGGTEVTEDAAAAANPTGKMDMCRRRDTLTAAEVSADSDVIAKNCTSKGEVYVKQTDPVAVTGTFWQATQPVSGTITANIGTSGSLALDATLTGGTQKAINRGGAKGSTSAADVTSTASGANHQPLDVVIYDTSGNAITSFGGSGGTSSNFGSAFPTPGTAAGFTDGTNMVAGRVVTSTPGTSDAGLVVRPINPNLAADNSTNSTSKVPVLVGVATTAAPTYTTTNQVPLSLTTAGGLRVDGSATTQPVSGTVTANAGTGNFTVVQGTGTNLHMVCDSGCSSSSGFADNGAFTFGTTAINPIGGVFDDTSPNTATENSAAIARITQNKAIHTNLRNASGTEIGTSGNPIRTDPTGTTTQPTNIAQINGVTPLMGAGNTGTGSPRVTIATDQASLNGLGVYVEDAAETAGGNLSMSGSVRRDTAASSAGSSGDNATINTDSSGLLWTRNADPCSALSKVYVPISQATSTQLLTGTASNRTYVCNLMVTQPAASTQTFSLVNGTGSVCATSTAAMIGATSAANGMQLPFAIGGANQAVAKSTVNADNVCLLQSGTDRIAGVISYVVAP